MAGALVSGVGIGLINGCAGAFLKPVSEALDISRAAFSAVGSISTAVSALVLPFFAKTLRKQPLKRVMLISAVICSLVPAGYALCQSIWQFYILAVINGLAVNGITMLTVGLLVFDLADKNRAAISGAAFAGTGVISSAALPPLRFVIERFGWQAGYLLQGGIAAAILLPTVLLLIENRVIGGEKEGNQRRNAPKALLGGIFLANFTGTAVYNHTLAHLSDIGIALGAATAVITAAALLSAVVKPVFGAIADKKGLLAAALIQTVFLFGASLFALYISGAVTLAVYALFLSGCTCAASVLSNAFANGTKQASAKQQLPKLMAAAAAGAVLGTPVTGAVYDGFKSYVTVFGILAALSLVSGALLACFALRDKKEG